MSTLLNVLLFLSAFILIVLVGINKDGGPLAKATEVVATLFIVCSLLLYLTR